MCSPASFVAPYGFMGIRGADSRIRPSPETPGAPGVRSGCPYTAAEEENTICVVPAATISSSRTCRPPTFCDQ